MDLDYLKGQRVLITGGTGSLGKKLIEIMLHKSEVSTIVVYSRDEYKQYLLKATYTKEQQKRLRFFIGDVRDRNRMIRAMVGVDFVIHAAAVKQVDTAEYNPDECIKTNVDGAQNVIDACLNTDTKGVVALSTDKACAPINLYGATKLVSDKLFCAANNIAGKHDIKFSVVRYGNVMGSRGSVIPFFMEKRKEGVLPITDEKMTRFNISLEEGAMLVLYTMNHHLGGEIFIPKIPSYRILDVAKAIAPDCKTKMVGIRPGEKLHEEMITPTDSLSTIDAGLYYAILPTVSFKHTESDYLKHHNGTKVPEGFSYNSGENTEWESIEGLREKIRQHVDSKFNAEYPQKANK